MPPTTPEDSAASPHPYTVALVPAAGRGVRMGGDMPKQYLVVGGVPLIVHSLRTLQSAPVVDDIVVAVPEADREYCRREIVGRFGLTKVRHVVAGGAQRQDSVQAALAAAEARAEIVVVHDAVRPFLTVEMIVRVCEAAARHGGAIIAIPARDTLKEVGEDGRIERTVDRTRLWQAQTPQAFRLDILQRAHEKARADRYVGTDEADLVQRLGEPVVVVEGSGDNIKVTKPEDLVIGDAIWASRAMATDR